jgi:pSer/pThr/pTyr-binding forkhead associated (FHA) protein
MSSRYPPDEDYPPNPPWGRDPNEPGDATLPGSERQPVRLRMQLGQSIGQVYTMVGNTLSLGRAPDNDVVLDDPQVSRHHARLMRRGDQIMVEDLGSTNGTLLNGQRVPPRSYVRLGLEDTLLIGRTELSLAHFK